VGCLGLLFEIVVVSADVESLLSLKEGTKGKRGESAQRVLTILQDER
jgi:hypothetical protein